MFKYVALCCGLLLAFLLVGHLALNATGVASGTLERSEPGVGKTALTGSSSATVSAEIQAKAAEDARYRAESRSRLLSAERRKELEVAASLAGLDPNGLANYSDSELIELLRNVTRASREATRGTVAALPSDDEISAARAILELQESEALKRSLEAEAGIASVPGTPTAPRVTLSGDAEKAALEALEAARFEAEKPESEPAPEVLSAPVSETSPDFAAAGESAGQVIAEETAPPAEDPNLLLEQRASDMIGRSQAGEQLTPAEKAFIESYERTHPASADPRGHGGSLDNTGGPDAGGYSYVDNVSPDTATYSWIELRGDPGTTWINSWTSHDDGYSYVGASSPGARHPIGFSFDFYGVMHDSFRVAANGFVQFTTTSGSLSNAALPATDPAGPAIFAYWDDLHLDRAIPTGIDVVGYKNFGTYTVIEFDSIGVYNSSCVLPNTRLKFEVILYNSGKIKIQYNLIDVCDAQDSSMTVGIQSNGTAGSAALQYCYGSYGTPPFTGPLPVAGRAIWFNPEVQISPYADDFKTSLISVPAAGVVYPPSSLVTVTAKFRNLGSTTQSSPVKYQFNAGGVVTEATASLAQGAFENYSFATQITTPATPGTYELVVWSDLAADEDHLNDTLRRQVSVNWDGYTCETAIILPSGVGTDSATFNNTGAGDNTPGVSCYASNYTDMVFKKEVLAGHTLTMWVSSLSWTSKYMNAAMRWSGACPGDTLIKCIYYQYTAGPTGYNQTFIWTNMTGSTQTVYFTLGSYYSGTGYNGNFKLAWKDTYYADDYRTTAITNPLATDVYGASQVLPVTATFMNFGSATQTSPVKYRFNNGAIVEETSASLAQFATDPHTFATTITTPTDTGNYPLWAWTDLVGDQDRLNDTVKSTVRVFPGGGCGSVITLTGDGPDSAQYNNNGAGTNSPGISCYANTYNDMVFKKDVLAGHKVKIWVSSLAWASKYMNASLRWGGSCRGDSLVKCVYNVTTAGLTGYNQRFVWTNTTGSTQTVYFTIGAYYTGSSYAGNFKLAWVDTEYDNDFSVTAITSPLTSAYMPNEVVTVTGTAINLGLTEQSSPIKYKFISGDSVVEATASLVRFATESHSFATQITLPAVNGNYSLWVYTDLATDQDRSDDTTKMTVKVFGGANCAMVVDLPGAGPDSATFNNCGADSNNPGGPCYPTQFFADMVVKKDVVAGNTITFWVSSMAASSKYLVASLRWGGACPGTNHVLCPLYMSSAPSYNRRFMWTNTTGSTQTVYFTFGNYYGGTSYCGNIKLAWKVETCAAVDPPVVQGFEGLPHMYTLPSCWTREDANGLQPFWECYTTYPRTGTYDVSIGGLAAGNNDWLFTPGINMEQDREYFLSYWRRVGSATYPDSIEVWAGLAPTSSAMTIPVVALDTCQRTVYVNKLGGFVCPASGVYYIGWRSRSMTSSSRTYIDDITIDASTACTGGTVTVNSTIGADSVTLNAQLGGGWSGGMPRYQWYTGEPCVNGNQVPGATTANYKTYVSGTFSCRVYIVDSLTCVACDSAIATVVDCQSPVSPPIQEGFEVPPQPVLPLCWTQQDVNADGRPWVSNTTYPRTGLQCAFNNYSVSGNPTNDWLFTRPLLLIADTVYYCEYWYRNYLTSYVEAMEVVAGTSRTPGGMPIIVDSLFTFTGVGTYTLRSRSFTVAETDTYYLAWHAASGDDEGGIKVDDIAIFTGEDCMAPDVTVNAVVGEDSARLKANAAGGLPSSLIQYQWYTGDSCDPESEIEGATADSLWVFDSGDYSCKAWCIDPDSCADCDSAHAEVIDCDIPLTVPWSESFDAVTYPTLPTCWTRQNVNGDTRLWQTYTSYYRSAPNCAWIGYTFSGIGPENDWLYSRAFSATAGDTFVIDYWYRMAWSSVSYTERMEVYAGTAADAASMTVAVDSAFNFNNIVYEQRAALFIAPATGTYYVGWHAISIENQGGIAVDDIRVYRYGTCAPPVVDVPSVATQVYVTLTATATGGYGGPTQYQWYTGNACLTGNEIVGATGRQYTTFTSGNYSCMAWYYDAETCSDCDSATATVVPDPCLPGGIPPIYEPWASPGLPTCWSQENGNGDSYSWGYSSSYYVSSPYSAYLYTSTTPANDWLFSGPVQLTQDTVYRISFWRRASSASYAQTLSLYVGTNRHSSAMTTTLLAPYTFTNTTFIQDVVDYTPTATGSYYFSLRNTTSVSSGSVYADDFRIFKVGTCDEPTTVTAIGGIGPDSARLVCRTVIGGFGGPLQFQWYTGESCTELNAIVGATDSVYWAPTEGIYSCKAYFVSSDTCGTCDSAYATVIICAPFPYNDWPTPFTEGFETTTGTALPDCWSKVDVNGDNRSWATIGSTTYARPPSLRCSYNTYSSGTPANDWMFTKGLVLTAGDTMNVDYWYRCYLSSASYWESLELFAGTSASVGAMTNVVDPYFQFSQVSTYTQRLCMFVVPSSGTYYFGWHAGYLINQGGVCVDDITIYKRGTCIAPTLADIPAVVYPAWVTLTANASGGFGSPIQYQWYTGVGCSPGNAIGGATTNRYTTSVSGIFSCRASRDTCGACDSAEVTITTPQPGELCSNAFTLAPPAHNDSSWVSGTTDGFYSHYPETCATAFSYSPDVFYRMTLPGSGDSACRRLTFVLRFVSPDTGDPFLVIYDGLANCGNTPLYCNDDDAQFFPLPPWDVPAQHPGWPSSYIAAELYPGTYLIRVGEWVDSSGAYTLTVYDNGPCYTPCAKPDSLTVTMSAADPTKVWLHFNAPTIGTYKVFSTIQKNNDGNPDMGADLQWVLDTTFDVAIPGRIEWNDLRATVAYRNYAVQHECVILGRCCYGDELTPSCANVTLAECQALSGTWNRYVTCESEECPVANQDPGETCETATPLGGPLPIVVSYTTLGHVNDVTMTGWTLPACWQVDFWTVSDANGPDVFWHYIIPTTGLYKFSMCPTTWDASMLIFSYVCPPTQATFICGNDDAGSVRCPTYSLSAVIDSLSLTASQHILIDVDGYSTTGGAFTLTITRY